VPAEVITVSLLSEETLLRITVRRAEVLREMAEGFSEREAAEHLGLSYETVRSHAEELKLITGCSTVREVGRWWRRNRLAWANVMLAAAGLPAQWGPASGFAP
jgi:DNA-binding NarL/FixJ family response regulator